MSASRIAIAALFLAAAPAHAEVSGTVQVSVTILPLDEAPDGILAEFGKTRTPEGEIVDVIDYVTLHDPYGKEAPLGGHEEDGQ